MRRLLPLVLAVTWATVEAAPPAPPPRVRLETSEGAIVIEVETKRAPITAANFLRYVDAKKFDGTTFYRAARAKSDPDRGLVQGGIDHNIRNSFFPIKHEPTTQTGLHHVDGTVSMARNAVGTAMGDFFITIGPAKQLDASKGYAGYAAFGHVVSGMPAVHRILAKPTFPGGFSFETMGQMIRQQVKIVSARRIR